MQRSLYVYKNKKDVSNDLRLALKEAKFVHILTVRGNDFQNEVFLPVVKDKSSHTNIRILLPNPYDSANNDWIEQREKELQKFDSSYGSKILKNQIILNINSILYIKKEQLEVRLHKYPIIGRIVITDRYVFFTAMQSSSLIRGSKTYKYSSSGSLYAHYARLFNQLWEVSRPISHKKLRT